MNKKYRIAVLGGEVEEKRQSRFITGFLRQTHEDNIDVCIFSMYRKYQDTVERESGDSNIFRLFNPLSFDGIVLIKDSIQTNGLCQEIENRIEEEFNGPVLVIDRESEFFPSVYEDDHAGMAALVTHLIEVHGYRDIAYISGKRWHPHAVKRLQGYLDTMKKFNLRVKDDMIYHGDFWYSSGEQAYRKFKADGRKLPEAVVCANDEMAIGLCEALEKDGLRVPEDIAVVGFDSTEEGRTGPRVLTSTILADEECGVYAAAYIRDRLNCVKEHPFMEKPKLFIGETCGCKLHDNNDQGCIRRTSWLTDRMAEGLRTVGNMMPDNLLMQPNLQAFLGTLYSYAYQLSDVESLLICLAPQWCDADKDASVHVSNTGYPDKMICALRYNKSGLNGMAGTEEEFDSQLLIPEFAKEHEESLAYFFTPLFFGPECFGYAAVSYGDKARSYDVDYRMWLAEAQRDLEGLRRSMLIEALKKQLESGSHNKFGTVDSRYELLSDEEKEDFALVGRILDENLLTYFFQPIVRASDGSIFSYEALMRSTTEKRISPLDIIKYANLQGRLIDVERATFFNVLKFMEAESSSFGDAKVFINSIPGVKLKDDDFESVKELISRNAHRTVVELTEEAELEDSELDAVKELFDRLNIQIAIDDYGTGYSNISNLLRYMPNYVKIDRALLSGIDSKPQKQHFVGEIIKFCRDNDIMSLAEGIETTEELRKVIHMGVDLIQGYYTAKPSAEIIPKINDMIRNEICTYYKEHIDGTDNRIYKAGKGSRVSLSMLSKDGYTDILIGDENAVYKDISIVGSPNMSTDLHVQILPGYNGVITLENASFSNIKGRPCIEISEGCDVTIKLHGDNTLKGNGILVPEGSCLTFIGDGNLSININYSEFYGIGNNVGSGNGEINFEQDGLINIKAMGQDGVCIGSGFGGRIRILKGQYSLKGVGVRCVGIGSIDGDFRFEISSCMMGIEVNAEQAVGIGSLESTSGLYLTKTSLNLTGSGDFVAAIGTLNGTDADVFIENSRVNISLRSDDSTCIGALNGRTDLGINHTSATIDNAGDRALIYGGFKQLTRIEMNKADIRTDVHNDLDLDTYAKDEDFMIRGGRILSMINDESRKRTIDFGPRGRS